MKDENFRSLKEDSRAKGSGKFKKYLINGLILLFCLVIIVIWLKSKIKKLYKAVKFLSDPTTDKKMFFIIMAVVCAVAAIIYLLFRKDKKTDKFDSTLFMNAIVAATGIVMIFMFIFLCIRSLA
ncbi:hypothetical protein [uncultured Ruminococcus sp.]|uniref:hypothetical protein n=1 Tax=uncultured Ruminococcus sp. TaxID=165186 RepID=UPI0025EAD437|nr:hypothetical protein [uncultured Ruminococcus sp.]